MNIESSNKPENSSVLEGEKVEKEIGLENLPVFAVIEQMEDAGSVDEMRELVPEFLKRLWEDLGIELTDDVNSLYQEMQDKHFLVRLENLSKVLHSLREKKPFEVGGGEDHYANAVIPENEGLKIAFSEGDAPIGPVRLLVGFNVKSVLSFDPKDLEVSDIDMKEFDPRDQVLRAALCRHVSGKLNPEDIKHLVMRIPRKMFPEDELTEEEVHEKTLFIFRGTRLSGGKSKDEKTHRS